MENKVQEVSRDLWDHAELKEKPAVPVLLVQEVMLVLWGQEVRRVSEVMLVLKATPEK